MTSSISAWLASHAQDSFMYLTTTGRASGNPHRIEIWFGNAEDRVYLMSGGGDKSDWVKNLIVDPYVTVEFGREEHAGVAHVVSPDSDEDTFVRDLLVNKYGKDRDLSDWRARSLPIVITFPSEAI